MDEYSPSVKTAFKVMDKSMSYDHLKYIAEQAMTKKGRVKAATAAKSIARKANESTRAHVQRLRCLFVEAYAKAADQEITEEEWDSI
jgi:hypothetical protein